ncbi:alpha/beta fold hydrolase [Klenkia taihuensis]|uniref:Pimeloyl-ACP methyl ester carboxylesterase n=1 Tax=Klenkia taihuensis TaxID=1225127 RepID=A0A1I1P404_9ACTN|nr:alpha/beta hydrolase [Klenkia taihuensis]GHE11659.1 alpha/beta hydrolase [Klenkia taihuensis]SFD01713.1 Pimeloyl-ACP methyl ester carboxylesterase [Klenkia taihuensis]
MTVPTDDAGPEHSHLAAAAAAFGVPVERFELARLQARNGLSALRYGTGRPAVALLHGGGQNAHTWDVTMAAAGLAGVAVDLPGHGRSPWTTDHDHSPRRLTPAVRGALAELVPDCRVLVGMSLGGMVAVDLAASLPDLQALVLVDVAPGSAVPPGSTVGAAQRLARAPLDVLVEQVHRLSPERDPAPLRHGIWHATRDAGDGDRAWRADPDARVGSFVDLWPQTEALAPRLHLVLAEHGSFVPPADLTRLGRVVRPGRVHRLAGATHSVQSTRPRALADVLVQVAAEAGARPGTPA